MSDIADFIRRGAERVTPAVVEGMLRQLPMLKVEFTQIKAPKYPHLVDQLEFLADAVEDFGEGLANELPYYAVAEAVFAILYAHRIMDLIPGGLEDYGHADDSGVVRAVLMRYEKEFSKYAETHKFDWSTVTIEP